MSIRRVSAICLCIVLASSWHSVGAEDEDQNVVYFDETIAPILARRCAGCHNGFDRKGGLNLVEHQAATTGGESGAVIVPNRSDASLLWQRIRDDEMPPTGELPESEKERLRKWIDEGAAWGNDPIDIFRFSTEKRAGRDWWSLQPPRRPEVAESIIHPIDYFVRRKLAEHKRTPSGPANRRTLIRRLSFSLLGLPPDPPEVETFVNDPDPAAYERLVDKLLESHHYGERWARHWLDVARYGESDGFEYDRMRPDAWHYRDWVIDALNSDLPYDEFAKLQIAGDVIRPDDPAAITATGFLVSGAFDGLIPQGDVMKRIMRQDTLEDFVGTTCQTFLGLTTHCARCHDHKFDPIPQSDYYRMAAALAGVTHGTVTVPAVAQRIEPLRQQIGELDADIEKIERPIRDQILAERFQAAARGPTTVEQLSQLFSRNLPDNWGQLFHKVSGIGPTPPTAIAEWDFSRTIDQRLAGQFFGNAKVENGSLVLDGDESYFASEPLAVSLRQKTIEVRVRLDSLDQRGGGAISVQTPDGSQFDAVVFAEQEPRKWLAGSNSHVRTRPFQGTDEQVDDEFVDFTIVYAADGTITGYRNGLPYGQPYRTDGPVEFSANGYHVLFGLRHTPAGGDRALRGKILLGRIYDRALTAEQVKASTDSLANHVDRSAILERIPADQAISLNSYYQRRDQIVAQLSRHDRHAVYAVVPQAPAETRLLRRGNPLDEGPVLAPGGLSALSVVSSEFGLAADSADADRRAKLAAWIASEHNPLFARVIVNRLWHYHFGRGLVATPNDLGFNGGIPSHPELLDWLATMLIENRWSLKSIHRSIVTSQTFRQASVERKDAMLIDADNRLLWRFPARRLDAEEIRDAMLAVSGQLHTTIGGPPFRDVRPYFHRGSQFYEPIDPAGSDSHRRSIYRMWARGGRSPMLDVFDCPDPSATAPVRGRTTTPLQALTMMNHAFALRMADELSRRIEWESQLAGMEPSRVAFRLTLCRDPDQEELNQTTAFVAEHGLAAFCRVILNSNEFLHVE